MFETLGEKAEEKAMVQFLERFTDYPFLVKFKNSEYPIRKRKSPATMISEMIFINYGWTKP